MKYIHKQLAPVLISAICALSSPLIYAYNDVTVGPILNVDVVANNIAFVNASWTSARPNGFSPAELIQGNSMGTIKVNSNTPTDFMAISTNVTSANSQAKLNLNGANGGRFIDVEIHSASGKGTFMPLSASYPASAPDQVGWLSFPNNGLIGSDFEIISRTNTSAQVGRYEADFSIIIANR